MFSPFPLQNTLSLPLIPSDMTTRLLHEKSINAMPFVNFQAVRKFSPLRSTFHSEAKRQSVFTYNANFPTQLFITCETHRLCRGLVCNSHAVEFSLEITNTCVRQPQKLMLFTLSLGRMWYSHLRLCPRVPVTDQNTVYHCPLVPGK